MTCPLFLDLNSATTGKRRVGNRKYAGLTLDKELGEVNEAENVGFEHGFNVILSNVTDMLNTEDETSIVDYHLHVSSRSGQSYSTGSPRMSTSRRSEGTLSKRLSTCLRSDTSNGMEINLPPSFNPDA